MCWILNHYHVLLKKGLVKWALILSFYSFVLLWCLKTQNVSLSEAEKSLPTPNRYTTLSSFDFYFFKGEIGNAYTLNIFLKEKSAGRYVQGDLLWPRMFPDRKPL